MSKKQLLQIRKFAKTFYRKTDKYHDWGHVLRVRKHALSLAKEYGKVDARLLEAACYLHDIGRSKRNLRDIDHVQVSVNLSENFLIKIGLARDEIEAINHAVFCHHMTNIKFAKTIEAKILFDADKLEIASVNGFVRMCCWLVEEKQMKPHEAVNFLWKNIKTAWDKDYVQTKKTRTVLKKEIRVIKKVVAFFNEWEQALAKRNGELEPR